MSNDYTHFRNQALLEASFDHIDGKIWHFGIIETVITFQAVEVV